jgi:hypothetical protein
MGWHLYFLYLSYMVTDGFDYNALLGSWWLARNFLAAETWTTRTLATAGHHWLEVKTCV